jgi:hypothetical protein
MNTLTSNLVGKRFYHHTNRKQVYAITKVEEDRVHMKWEFGYKGSTSYSSDDVRQFFKEGTWIFESESLLEQAKRLYPVGTKFKCLHDCSGGPVASLDEIRLDEWDTIRWYEKGGRGCGCIYNADMGGWAEIIPEEIKPTNMPTAQLTQQSISRSNLKAIHSRVCGKWQAVIKDKLKENIFDESIFVPNDLLIEAFKEADSDQTKLLLRYFYQPLESKEVNMNEWIEDIKLFKKSCIELIDVRESGKYGGKAFYLRSDFKWEIKADEYGLQCLVPTKN